MAGRPADAAAVGDMLDAAEPLQSAHVLVVGAETLDVLCGLIGRGVAAALETTLAGRLPGERSEIVLVPHAASLSEAAQAVALARRALLPCGRIVLQDPDGLLATSIAHMLRAAGFSAIRVRTRASGTIVSADWPMFGPVFSDARALSHA